MASITPRGESYLITVSVTHGGKRERETMTWKPPAGMSKRDIEREKLQIAADFENRVLRGEVFDSKLTFSEYLEIWKKDYSAKKHRASTQAGYGYLYPQITAGLGHLTLAKITSKHIKEFISNFTEEGVRRDSTYALAVDLDTHIKKHGGVKKAAAECGITRNVFSRMKQGDSVNYKTATAICKVFKLKLDKTFLVDSKGQYAEATVKKCYNLISRIFKSAVYDGLISDNPCVRVEPPKVQRNEAKAFSEDEVLTILNGLESEEKPFRAAIYLLLDTGMRRGELCGLKWNNIDIEHGYITITGSLLYTAEKGLFDDSTKTESAIRTVYLSEYMIPILKTYKAWQAEQRFMAGDQWQDNDYVFTRWNGAPMRPDTLSNQFKKFVVSHDLPPLPLKSLRHTNATMLVMAAVPVRAISDRLGHAQTTTTLDVYSHAVKSMNQHAAQFSPLSSIGNK